MIDLEVRNPGQELTERLTERRVMVRHVLRNSMIPIITLFGLDLGLLLGGGAILTETVFDLQGVGQYFAESIRRLETSRSIVQRIIQEGSLFVDGAAAGPAYRGCPFINAAGTYTAMTASLMPPEVLDAIAYASRHYVMLDELHDKVGERIAALLRAEAAMVTSGASVGSPSLTPRLLRRASSRVVVENTALAASTRRAPPMKKPA